MPEKQNDTSTPAPCSRPLPCIAHHRVLAYGKSPSPVSLRQGRQLPQVLHLFSFLPRSAPHAAILIARSTTTSWWISSSMLKIRGHRRRRLRRPLTLHDRHRTPRTHTPFLLILLAPQLRQRLRPPSRFLLPVLLIPIPLAFLLGQQPRLLPRLPAPALLLDERTVGRGRDCDALGVRLVSTGRSRRLGTGRRVRGKDVLLRFVEPAALLPAAGFVEVATPHLRVHDAGHDLAQARERDGFEDPAVEASADVSLSVPLQQRGGDGDDGHAPVQRRASG